MSIQRAEIIVGVIMVLGNWFLGYRYGVVSRPFRKRYTDDDEREIGCMAWQLVQIARGNPDVADPDMRPVTGSHQVDLREEARRRARFWPEQPSAQEVNWEARVIEIRQSNALAIYAVQEGRDLAAYDHLVRIVELCSLQLDDKGDVL